MPASLAENLLGTFKPLSLLVSCQRTLTVIGKILFTNKLLQAWEYAQKMWLDVAILGSQPDITYCTCLELRSYDHIAAAIHVLS